MKRITESSLALMPTPYQTLGTYKGFTLEVCMNEQSLNTACHLRYRAYGAVGAVPDNEEQVLKDAYDYSPNARTFLVWYQGKAVATVRSSIYSEVYHQQETEGMTYFRQDIQNWVRLHTSILESGRFAVDPDFQGRQSLYARLLLFRAHGLNAASHGCTHLITAVRAGHVSFFKRFLDFETLSLSPRYVEWFGTEVVLLANSTRKCHSILLDKGMPDFDQEDILQYTLRAKLPAASQEGVAA